ncbi:MAG TPA: uroporphyrinogen decarboxylase family protein [Anaerolineae bacterium]|nr:uroporphyrinogen decarboxylase family protein [Anaerolineae bacterium]HOQ99586.1 uroporphyrinogen decarboxylase family protein [Anaerolineae bacterium]HPL28780.1 uroporphyrinogen decarboxylase family protein [Anaerolineae bacterium]
MSDMTAIERIEKHINLQQPDRVAVAPMGGYYYATLAGMSVADVLTDPWKCDEAFEYAYNKHGGFDMAEGGFLLSLYLAPLPDPFSTFYLDWHLPGRERPPDAIPNLNERAREQPLMTEADYDLVLKEGFHRFFSFRRAGAGDLARMAAMAPVAAQIAHKWRDERQVPLMIDGGLGDPFGLLSELRGNTNFLLDLRRRPGKVLEVLDILCDGMIAAGINQAKMLSARTLVLGSARASADFVSPKMFEQFCLPFLVRMAHAMVEAGCRLQYHFDTNWTPLLEYLKELPPKSGYLHLDERSDIIAAKRVLGDHLCLFGNLKPSLFVLGTEAEVEREVKTIIDGCAAGGGLIISAELDAGFRFELVDKMVQVTKTYGRY